MQCSIPRESNLGDGPQDFRLRVGATAFALGLVLAVAMLKLGAPPALRLLLAVPFFLGANFLYQGLFRTCVGLASQGMRDTGDGPTPIADRDELARVRRSAMIVMGWSILSAALGTALFVIV
ncbi:MAG: hypothetical protein ABJE95_19085 [Byssovorax sp.]